MPAVMTLLMLLSSFGTALWPSGMILCIEENGSVALEGSLASCCGGAETAEVPATRSDEGCGACKDLVSVDARPRHHLPAAMPVPALPSNGWQATTGDVVNLPSSLPARGPCLPPQAQTSNVLLL